MRVAVTTTQLPFMRGGAELHAESLVRELRNAGHESELVTMPFRFQPAEEVLRSMDAWSAEDLARLDCGDVDAVICLKFPTYYLTHPKRIVWLLHQHRAVYDLWQTEFDGGVSQTPVGRALREEIVRRDTMALRTARALFTNSATVSRRLERFNGVASVPLYHPPAGWESFYGADALPYIFYPSRLQPLKRQELLIRAMARVRAPVCAIIAGEGALHSHLEHLIERLDLQARVRLVGRISDSEMRAWYAHALGVFFGPRDEDYGYVTLEAMLSSKPVITCTDSGGPLEFVVSGETGFLVDPTPEAIADAIERLHADHSRAADMGHAARRRYDAMMPSWDVVIRTLLQAAAPAHPV
jgi:glycosyltransferase involved in cell wall biosynthesis